MLCNRDHWHSLHDSGHSLGLISWLMVFAVVVMFTDLISFVQFMYFCFVDVVWLWSKSKSMLSNIAPTSASAISGGSAHTSSHSKKVFGHNVHRFHGCLYVIGNAAVEVIRSMSLWLLWLLWRGNNCCRHCHRLEGVQTLHLERDSHCWGCFVKEDSLLHWHVETISRNRFPLANVFLPLVQGDLIGRELWGKGLHIEDCAHETLYSRRCILVRISWSTHAMLMLHSSLWFLWSLPTLVLSRSSPRRGRVSGLLQRLHPWGWSWFSSCSCLGSSNLLRLPIALELVPIVETRSFSWRSSVPLVLLSAKDRRFAKLLQLIVLGCQQHVVQQIPPMRCSATMKTLVWIVALYTVRCEWTASVGAGRVRQRRNWDLKLCRV